MKRIELKNIEKIYGKGENSVNALKNISIIIEKGELVAIMGTSGSGKSTLLNIVGSIDEPSAGSYCFNGRDINDYTQKEKAILRNKEFGFVMQDFALIPHYTVKRNVQLPLYYTKYNKKERDKRVEEVLKKVKLEKKQNFYPAQLSGGQKQRVAIARALVNDAEVLLCDEPTGALDSKTSKEIMEIFVSLHKLGKTIVIITHDKEIAGYCNRLIKLEDGEIIEDIQLI